MRISKRPYFQAFAILAVAALTLTLTLGGIAYHEAWWAENYSHKMVGYVIDDSTGKPLEGAKISIGGGHNCCGGTIITCMTTKSRFEEEGFISGLESSFLDLTGTNCLDEFRLPDDTDAVTDNTGKFTFYNLPLTVLDMDASLPNFISSSPYVAQVDTAIDKSVTFYLSPPATLIGTLKDYEGKPIADAPVFLDNRPTITKNDGTFEFKNLRPSAYKIKIYSNSLDLEKISDARIFKLPRSIRDITVAPGENLKLDIKLDPEKYPTPLQ